MKGRPLGQTAPVTHSEVPAVADDAAAGKKKAHSDTGAAADAGPGRKKAVSCGDSGGEDGDSQSRKKKKKAKGPFPVPLRPLGCAAKSHGEQPTCLSPRDEAAAVLLKGSTLYIFGGCFLEVCGFLSH